MQQNGNWAKTQSVKNDYLYNGKELNTEIGLNWSDYGFRYYDAAIGRFTGVDPLSDKFAYLSTYNYAGNSPIANIDLWGLQPVPYSVPFNDGNNMTTIPDYYEAEWVDFLGSKGPISKFVENWVIDEIPVLGEAIALYEGDIVGFLAGLLPGGKKIKQGVEKIVDIVDDAKGAKKAVKTFDGKLSTESVKGKEAFGKAKEANGIPKSQQPDKTIKPNTPDGDAAGLDSRNVRQYEYTNSKGEKVTIRQDKPAKYNDGGQGDQGPHYNAGQSDSKLKQHHNYKKSNNGG